MNFIFNILQSFYQNNEPSKIYINKEGLELVNIQLSNEYLKEWNEHNTDFLKLYKNDVPINDSIYRLGAFNDKKSCMMNDYFMLLKYIEAVYPSNIKSTNSNGKHLSGQWCIIDKYGNEKVFFEKFKSPYLIKDSCLYQMDNIVYHIDSNKPLCDYYYDKIESEENVVLNISNRDNRYKSNIIIINKKTAFIEELK